MNTLVVDASIAAAWLLEDEDELGANEVAERLGEEQAVVPNLWHAEIRNAFLVAERRGRLSRRAVDERVGLLNAIPVRTDYAPDLQAAFESRKGAQTNHLRRHLSGVSPAP